MGIRVKFNVMLILVFGSGLGLSAWMSDELLKENAREEVLQKGRIMIEGALAIRGYTAKEIYPLIADKLDTAFLPQTVSAYAAAQNFRELRKNFPDYVYKEAALNPTNPDDRASDWEADIIHEFRNNPDRKEIISQRDTPTGPTLNLARPIIIKNESCLVCHSHPSAAPASMIAEYGSNNGFGWKMGEVVAAQIVTVPMSLPLDRAHKTFYTFLSALGAIFVLVFVLVNILLHCVVIKPVERMSKIAEDVSLGKMDIPEYTKKGNDEIASLSKSFNRMRRSLQNALKLLDE